MQFIVVSILLKLKIIKIVLLTQEFDFFFFELIYEEVVLTKNKQIIYNFLM